MVQKQPDERRTLDEHGIIFVTGEIDVGTAREVGEKIIEFNISQEIDSIQLMISSTGGQCAAGFAIVDLMAWSRLPVFCTGIGMVGSMALAIFMAGEKGHRVVTPRTSILSHRFSALVLGNHSELLAHRREEDLMHRRVLAHYLQHTRLTSEDEVTSRLLRDVDTWLSPEEAVELGIADVVQQDRAPGRVVEEVAR